MEPQEVKAKSSFMLPMNFTGTPAPKAKWYRNGIPLSSRPGFVNIDSGDQFSTLTVKGMTQDDAGKYRIVVENEAGKDEATVDVRVTGK